MKKTFALIFYCFLVIGTYAQNNKVKTDTAYVSRLTPRESRVIRNLVNTDSSFVHTQINLQTELLKYDANLLYKYRLDSIQTDIPLDYNIYVQSFIDAFINRTAQIGRMISLGNYYFPIFEKALKQYKIPEEFKYLPIVESSMDPHAVSRVGATGLWQFMYTTGKGYGLTIDNYIDERKDPISSSFAAAAYLRNAYNELGDWLLAMASYNCGIGAVKRALIRAGGTQKTFWEIKNLLPRETQDYVPKFIAVAYIMHYFDSHNTKEIPELDFKIDIDSIYVNRMVSFDSLADVLDMERKELQILNPAYKKNIVNGSPSDPKRLIIPKVDLNTYAALFDVLHTDKVAVKYMPASVQPQTNASAEKIYHTVKKGETLGAIANKYRVEVQDIKVWNNLKGYTIVPGQKLNVKNTGVKNKEKAPGFIAYTVRTGDTLSSIAKRFSGVSVAAIQEWNNLKGNQLSVGKVLQIKSY